MIDVLICNIPGTIGNPLMAAPAILKSMIQAYGFRAQTIDYNARFYKEISGTLDRESLENYFVEKASNRESHEKAMALVSNWVKEIKAINPKYIGLSVFTYQCRVATELFCAEIRRQMPQTKIVLGGQGIPDGGINGSSNWIDRMAHLKLYDHWIKSEGEYAIVELLKDGINDKNINTFDHNQITNLDELPLPDYSDYEFDLYDQKILPITGSRGCVRKCSFCDIHTHWKKFTFRSGESLAREMITQSTRYGITKFRFTDSLVNGNQKQYRQFIDILARHNQTAATPITWTGQFIIRKKSNSDDETWRLTGLSGANKLAIGIESGSESVRKHIGKEFSNHDIDYAMECMHKYGISCIFLMLIGYPTETAQDFNDTLDMFRRYSKYANNVIANIEFGSTLGILPNTPLSDQATSLGITMDPRHENFWTSSKNPDLTFKERLKRRFTARQLVLDLGYQISDDPHKTMLHYLWRQYNSIGQAETEQRPVIVIKNAESYSGS